MASTDALAHELHGLVRRLDVAAERILRTAHGLTYARYRALLAVHELDGPSQRELAESAGQSEAAVSRMVASLVDRGLIEARPGGGRTRRLALTEQGDRLRADAARTLEGRLEGLAESVGVDHRALAGQVRLLTGALDRVAAEDVTA
ncbi:MarR family transcriptional regulator [Nocardioidaceae bacterium]|nr:MarR family transcriptional regulator [Nocardioidaceae bacterium]